MNLLEALHKYTLTENGAISNRSTGSALLNLYANGGAMRGREESFWTDYLVPALRENPKDALGLLAWIYDCRNGCGERDLFLHSFVKLPESVQRKNLARIPGIGRWDMLVRIWERSDSDAVRAEILRLCAHQLSTLDREGPSGAGGSISLCAKWMPREGKAGEKFARALREEMKISSRDYRQLLAGLCRHIDVIEQKMSAARWGEIEYAKVPSKAGLIYRAAFRQHDGDRYRAYLSEVLEGKEKINAGVLYPHELVSLAFREDDDTVEAKWRALPELFGDRGAAILPVIDVSGSMGSPLGKSSVTAMQVAIGLGLYLAGSNPSEWGGHFFTFHEEPQWIEIEGTRLFEKVRSIRGASWGGSTNIQAVFARILHLGAALSLPPADMPRAIVIVSDMEFDSCGSGTNLKAIVSGYQKAGYPLPKIVFWNVQSRNIQFPATTEDDVLLIGGYSPSVARTVIAALCKGQIPTAMELMAETIERYADWLW